MISQFDQVPDSPLDETNYNIKSPEQVNANFVQALAQEMMNLIKGKGMIEAQLEYVHSFTHLAGMIGKSSHSTISCAV